MIIRKVNIFLCIYNKLRCLKDKSSLEQKLI